MKIGIDIDPKLGMLWTMLVIDGDFSPFMYHEEIVAADVVVTNKGRVIKNRFGPVHKSSESSERKRGSFMKGLMKTVLVLVIAIGAWEGTKSIKGDGSILDAGKNFIPKVEQILEQADPLVAKFNALWATVPRAGQIALIVAGCIYAAVMILFSTAMICTCVERTKQKKQRIGPIGIMREDIQTSGLSMFLLLAELLVFPSIILSIVILFVSRQMLLPTKNALTYKIVKPKTPTVT